MKRRELIKKIEKQGGVFVRHGGNHDWYQNPRTWSFSASSATLGDQRKFNVLRKLANPSPPGA